MNRTRAVRKYANRDPNVRAMTSAALANPGDTNGLLVLADALQESGDPRGELLRAHVRAGSPAVVPSRQADHRQGAGGRAAGPHRDYRRLLATTSWLDPEELAAAASYLRSIAGRPVDAQEAAHRLAEILPDFHPLKGRLAAAEFDSDELHHPAPHKDPNGPWVTRWNYEDGLQTGPGHATWVDAAVQAVHNVRHHGGVRFDLREVPPGEATHMSRARAVRRYAEPMTPATEAGDYTPPDEEAAFHRAMLENPDDYTNLHGYADWLEDHGRTGLAAAVRSHIDFTKRIQNNQQDLGEQPWPAARAVNYSPTPGGNFSAGHLSLYPEEKWSADIANVYQPIPGQPGRHWNWNVHENRSVLSPMFHALAREGFTPHQPDEGTRTNNEAVMNYRPPARLARPGHPLRYLFRAPPHGMVAPPVAGEEFAGLPGNFVPGGEFVSDQSVVSDRSVLPPRPPERKAAKYDPQKLAAAAKRMKSKKVTVKPGTDDRRDLNLPQTPMTVSYARARAVRRYAMGDDIKSFVHHVTGNPAEMSTRGAFADYLDENNLADPEHTEILRSHPGPVRPVMNPNGRVTVHPWVTPRDQYRMANARVTDAEIAGEEAREADTYGPREMESHIETPHRATSQLANILAANHDPREVIVRNHADRVRSRKQIAYAGAPEEEFTDRRLLGPVDQRSATGVTFEKSYDRPGWESVSRQGRSEVRDLNDAKVRNNIPLPDGTFFGYEAFRHPDSGRQAAHVWWHAPAGNTYHSVLDPQTAADVVGGLSPQHGEKIRRAFGIGSQPHHLSRAGPLRRYVRG